MDFQYEMILIIVGAIISIIPTIISKFVDGWIDYKGEIRIYKKIVYDRVTEKLGDLVVDRIV